ncbi:hypothetical protein [Modestobacter altitudinis]|uniref:hypothetical protein n=1 Tax=Modestobacter altitudinis TaxID=2213158 RepID=UPI00110CFF42|nr:hypothetical protein [Modestobacter altitudinis]
MNIEVATRSCFGDELGNHLLANRAILPLRDKRPAAGIRNHNAGVDLSKSFGPHNGLAIINGELSGIVTVDLDSADLHPPAPINVETAKGGHIYLPWAGQVRALAVVPKVDVLGAGGYSEFVGPGKRFLRPDFADTDTVSNWLASLSPSYVKGVLLGSGSREYGKRVSPDSVSRECMYPEKLRALGYRLRVDTISKTYASQMRSAAVGTRNNLCFRYALEVLRCGADLEAFTEAAVDSGLTPDEVHRTIRQAEASIELDYRPEIEVFERVQGWLAAHAGMKGITLDLAQCLAFEAIECNTTRPQLSQVRAAMDVGSDAPYVGRVLKIMADKHRAVRVHVPKGRQANGLSHCNNYELTIEGVTI